MVSRAESFAPEWREDARVLVLGSIPGVASLQAQRYYAHPRNAFWPIMAELLGFDPALAYRQRLEVLKQNGVALWDVIESCYRPGSLDSRIAADSVAANDIAALVRRMPQLRLIACNGKTAQRLYLRHWAKVIAEQQPDNVPSIVALPSTSPAHAAMNFDQKLAAWRVLLDALSLPNARRECSV